MVEKILNLGGFLLNSKNNISEFWSPFLYKNRHPNFSNKKKKDIQQVPAAESPSPSILLSDFGESDSLVSNYSNELLPSDISNYNELKLYTQQLVTDSFTPKKIENLKLADIYDSLDFHSRADRVRDCGTFLEFHISDSDSKLAKANFCKDRLCPMCNWRRSLKIFGTVSQIMNVLESLGYQFMFLTLTVRSVPDTLLAESIDNIISSYRSMSKYSTDYKKAVFGSFHSLEVTHNYATGLYHPHLHCILAVQPSYFKKCYISQNKWSLIWQHYAGLDYSPVVDIRRIKATSDKSLAGVVAEVSKYSVKSVDYLNSNFYQNQKTVQTLLSSLSSRRLVSMTGCFRDVAHTLNIKNPEDVPLVDDLRDDIKYCIVKYHWKNGFYMEV